MATNRVTNTSERLVACSFCNEEYPPATIGNHLMMCGNRTDPCPNCKKYIRRAIFAYHYENQCANLDEGDADVKPAVNQPPALLTPQINPSAPPAPVSATENNQDLSLIDFDPLPISNSQTTTSDRSRSAITTIVCPYCAYESEINEYDVHKENCLKNPDNPNKRQRPTTYPTSTQNPVIDPQVHIEERNNAAEIPCEICNEPVIISNFDAHTRACIQRQREQTERNYYHMNNNIMTQCRYCHYQYTIYSAREHEMRCLQNPANAVTQGRYFGSIYIPPMRTWFRH